MGSEMCIRDRMVYRDRTKEEMEQLTSLVKSAVGYDADRGDLIEVENMKFVSVDNAPEAVETTMFFGFTKEEIMRMFWSKGPMFVRDLLELYNEPKPHYNTVSTLVRGLEEKGFVGYKVYGNTYQYHPVISESEYKGSALNEVVSQFYDNSYINVVSQLIEEERMLLDELKDLIARIEKGRK